MVIQSLNSLFSFFWPIQTHVWITQTYSRALLLSLEKMPLCAFNCSKTSSVVWFWFFRYHQCNKFTFIYFGAHVLLFAVPFVKKWLPLMVIKGQELPANFSKWLPGNRCCQVLLENLSELNCTFHYW